MTLVGVEFDPDGTSVRARAREAKHTRCTARERERDSAHTRARRTGRDIDERTEPPAQQVQIVDASTEHHRCGRVGAGALGGAAEREGEREGADAERAVAHAVAEPARLPVATVVEDRAELDAGVRGDAQHLVALGDGRRERLLTQHMHAARGAGARRVEV